MLDAHRINRALCSSFKDSHNLTERLQSISLVKEEDIYSHRASVRKEYMLLAKIRRFSVSALRQKEF